MRVTANGEVSSIVGKLRRQFGATVGVAPDASIEGRLAAFQWIRRHCGMTG